jgi:hypothetical protein
MTRMLSSAGIGLLRLAPNLPPSKIIVGA